MVGRYITAIFILLFLTSFLSAGLDIVYDNQFVPRLNIGEEPTGNITIFQNNTFNNITNNFIGGNQSFNQTLTDSLYDPLGSGIVNISQAGDVDVSGVNDNDVLKWNDAVKQWIGSRLNSIISFGNDYLFFSGDNEITFNETRLNLTIDARSGGGGNVSWNQSLANTLYLKLDVSNAPLHTNDLTLDSINVSDANSSIKWGFNKGEMYVVGGVL